MNKRSAVNNNLSVFQQYTHVVEECLFDNKKKEKGTLGHLNTTCCLSQGRGGIYTYMIYHYMDAVK